MTWMYIDPSFTAYKLDDGSVYAYMTNWSYEKYVPLGYWYWIILTPGCENATNNKDKHWLSLTHIRFNTIEEAKQAFHDFIS